MRMIKITLILEVSHPADRLWIFTCDFVKHPEEPQPATFEPAGHAAGPGVVRL